MNDTYPARRRTDRETEFSKKAVAAILEYRNLVLELRGRLDKEIKLLEAEARMLQGSSEYVEF